MDALLEQIIAALRKDLISEQVTLRNELSRSEAALRNEIAGISNRQNRIERRQDAQQTAIDDLHAATHDAAGGHKMLKASSNRVSSNLRQLSAEVKRIGQDNAALAARIEDSVRLEKGARPVPERESQLLGYSSSSPRQRAPGVCPPAPTIEDSQWPTSSQAHEVPSLMINGSIAGLEGPSHTIPDDATRRAALAMPPPPPRLKLPEFERESSASSTTLVGDDSALKISLPVRELPDCWSVRPEQYPAVLKRKRSGVGSVAWKMLDGANQEKASNGIGAETGIKRARITGPPAHTESTHAHEHATTDDQDNESPGDVIAGAPKRNASKLPQQVSRQKPTGAGRAESENRSRDQALESMQVQTGSSPPSSSSDEASPGATKLLIPETLTLKAEALLARFQGRPGGSGEIRWRAPEEDSSDDSLVFERNRRLKRGRKPTVKSQEDQAA